MKPTNAMQWLVAVLSTVVVGAQFWVNSTGVNPSLAHGVTLAGVVAGLGAWLRIPGSTT